MQHCDSDGQVCFDLLEQLLRDGERQRPVPLLGRVPLQHLEGLTLFPQSESLCHQANHEIPLGLAPVGRQIPLDPLEQLLRYREGHGPAAALYPGLRLGPLIVLPDDPLHEEAGGQALVRRHILPDLLVEFFT